MIDGTQVTNEVNQRMNEVTTHFIYKILKNDKIKIRIRNLTNNNDCRVTNIHTTVLKLN